MAYAQNVKYIYPANFVEGTSVMNPYQRRIVVRVTGFSDDTTNASASVAIDKSDLLGPNRAEPSSLVIEELEWSVVGYDAVVLAYDDGTDEIISRLSVAGFKDYKPFGGLTSDGSSQTGDILITTTGAVADSHFDITIVARLKE